HDLEDREAPMGLGMSFLPYFVLIGVAIATLTVPPLKAALGAFTVGMSFPAVSTGFGVLNEAAEPYSPFAPLTHPGTFLLITSFVTWFVYRARGYYDAWAADDDEEEGSLWSGLLDESVPASVPIIAF